MHPDVVLLADVGDGDEGVKGSVHRRPGGRTHKERHKALHGEKNNTKACSTRPNFCLRLMGPIKPMLHEVTAVYL